MQVGTVGINVTLTLSSVDLPVHFGNFYILSCI